MGVDGGQSREEQQLSVSAFVTGHVNHVLVISYEMFRKHVDRLRPLSDALFICDEGHRLKNAKGNATINALQSIASKRRLILTGTPVQNDLMEFYAMCDFVNPSILGSMHTFRLTFEAPIQRSREASSSPADKRLGEARSAELNRLTASFVLRRTADILRKYLPPKTELVVFCRMTPLQREVYAQVLRSKTFKRAVDVERLPMQQHDALALTCIQTLKQISGHPALIHQHCASDARDGGDLAAAYDCFPEGYGSLGECSEADSGKMAVLMQLLQGVKADGGKVVVVSNSVEALNIIQAVCTHRAFTTLRLDGHTPAATRQSLVDQFNSPYSPAFVFLLSARAGGQGLNLIGGNRLVLFDPDWNPATDLQAMARIWRDGQALPCYIYRLMSTASIDEKILQRQMLKQEVAGTVMRDRRGQGSERVWDSRTLKELFKYKGTSDCETYDVLRGKGKEGGKKGAGVKAEPRGKEVQVSGKRWECVWNSGESDDALVKTVSGDLVSCVWSRISTADDAEEVDRVLNATTDDDAKEGDEDGGEEAKGGEEKEAAIGEEEETAMEEEEVAIESSDPIEDDDSLDWRRDQAEAKRARAAERRAKKKADAHRLALEDARLLEGEEEEEEGAVRVTKKRRKTVLEEDEEEELLGQVVPPSPPRQEDGRGEEEKDADDMSAIQALVNPPAPTSASRLPALTSLPTHDVDEDDFV